MDNTNYYLPDYESEISRSDLSGADRETQIAVIRRWFYQNYEDPAERTPYESREGGYIWIWGGPYEAREEVETEFYDIISEDVIDEVVTELDSQCWEWAPTEQPGDYDEYLVDDIAQITEFYHNYSNAIIEIEKLQKTKIESEVESCFNRLLYVNVITALETYLSDAFINTVVPEKK